MTFKRPDGRGKKELREIEAKAGIIKRANGSGYFRIGNTVAYAAVYGPRNIHPKFLQDPSKGVLRCNYNMMPFSSAGSRVRPGGNRRSKEIGLVTEKALSEVVMLTKYPNSVVDVFIELPQTDAGTRCAGISAASIALADAGIPMKDMISSVAVGKVGGEIVADLDYEEEAYDENTVDIPLAFTHRGKKVTLLQMDGKITRDELEEAIRLGSEVIDRIYEAQEKALKEKYIINSEGENHE